MTLNSKLLIGLDIGSTTIKCIALDNSKTDKEDITQTAQEIVYQNYERHFSCIVSKAKEMLEDCFNTLHNTYNENTEILISISGSAGMGLANSCGINFIQEVFATRIAAKKYVPQGDCIIELGGEDAKILFLTGSCEVRMNGSCAGGTGAFIDQMATLLNMTPTQMNEEAQNAEKVYTIASRCGVFAKSDIQPLLNQGAKKSDVTSSIFYAVCNQTIAGLAQGRPISGNVVYLGGPLTFLSSLRESFDKTLKTKGILPHNSLYFVALGAALGSQGTTAYKLKDKEDIISKFENYSKVAKYNYINPLFKNEEEYIDFKKRHKKASVQIKNPDDYEGDAYLGIDSGSTTVKAVIIDEDANILSSFYKSNRGNPVDVIKEYLKDFYEKYPKINIKTCAATGYGEDIIKSALGADFGIVETLAHFKGAKHFMSDVEFIIDIGGQDIKCFKIDDGVISDIFLNEACSSGCGSFLQTFANALGYNIIDFARLGLFADKPVDLGSRCTVFMNSSVKQAQKDGAKIENISAGLAISVVKNALYKVIRATDASQLGKKIVVQGGTFLNDAVLRAFEQELNIEVIRPSVAGLMGAFGCALYSKDNKKEKSNLLNYEQIKAFSHETKSVNCGLCSNNCTLTVNIFNGNNKYISGNKCERPVTKKSPENSDINIFDYKIELLNEIKKRGENNQGKRGTIGLPMVLNMFELLPFWEAFFESLGFCIKTSPFSNRKIYLKGQATIPSDTVCYPAKLAHGHIDYLLTETLKDEDEKTIFYPCLTYNLDEKISNNHFNCPVVAYYPEVINPKDEKVDFTFINDYFVIDKKRIFPKRAYENLKRYFKDLTLKEVIKAARSAYCAYEEYEKKIIEKGLEIIKKAEQDNKQLIVLCGRPYHADPEINHGIDKLITACGCYIISEEVASYLCKKENIKFKVNVLNQWTYHARLYSSANYVAQKDNINLIQMVSFGCGVDAITTDEVRSILHKGDKIYTQIKIDEITNPGAVKIRLRSLLAAIENK